MANRRINVLVYSGNGSTVESVRHCLYTLRRLLSPNYAVVPVNSDAIIKEPWTASCALLVLPGGADMAYCRTLNGEGNRRISQYVNRGGNYLGFCAGGYYGTSRCEFEVGDKRMEVVGDRELAFFPGTCRGLAFPGFVYHSEAGARAVDLKVNKIALPKYGETFQDSFKSYYNGGGAFVNAEKFKDRGVEILASYTEKLKIDAGEANAAIIYRKIGEGGVILTGPHPEFAAINLNRNSGSKDYNKTIDAIAEDDKARIAFLKACLHKLGLQVNSEEQAVPSLSHLHLSSQKASDVAELVSSWSEIITKSDDGEEYIKGENDTFHIEEVSSRWSMNSLTNAVTSVAPMITPSITSNRNQSEEADETPIDNPDRILDYDKVIKRLIAHETDLPSNRETPNFNHHAYFANLEHYNTHSRNFEPEFGKYLLYGEVVTSTNTILEKNPSLLSHLPTGFTATATTQIAGRGRGSNVWVAPPGSLLYSTVIRHGLLLNQAAPVVFIQYLAALATVLGIQSYGPGYAQLHVRLKWPNDIYALDPAVASKTGRANAEKEPYVKIGGVLVNSSYSGSEYSLVVGVGVNVANAAPTTSLNALAKARNLPPFAAEKLLACIMCRFEEVYRRFCERGWDRTVEETYYRLWLHTGQTVTLETAGGVRARIQGITRDWGLLLAEELGWQDRPTGKVWQLQSDSNSFDFFRGLVMRKV
ncbi:biotin holocarboxylase synthetase/biotin-protein ligase [Patellaria atrata CBS 101060]|uniref:Biotin holocarboxylase synthetase/biotin-protein ligase n=1 Tax=Patellaria atrata CBS 101060 TaxID=1346257 RepID=A0A9P4SHR2_9PEZI|nr:biotin holocarboxylase synthetase/biotin-protein ligase [Patellaria atrata CBS 101060]